MKAYKNKKESKKKKNKNLKISQTFVELFIPAVWNVFKVNFLLLNGGYEKYSCVIGWSIDWTPVNPDEVPGLIEIMQYNSFVSL